MKRGEVYWVEFEAAVGGEIKKRRPAVIVSNDAANRFLNRVQVVPITSQLSKLYPSEAIVSIHGQEQKAMADQIATVSKVRLGNRLGAISPADMAKVERAILLQLGLQAGERGM